MEKGNSGRGGEERVPGSIDVSTIQSSQFIYTQHLSVKGCTEWDGCIGSREKTRSRPFRISGKVYAQRHVVDAMYSSI